MQITVSELRRLWADRRAVTAVEYGLLAAMIAGAILAAVVTSGSNLTRQFTDIAAKLTY